MKRSIPILLLTVLLHGNATAVVTDPVLYYPLADNAASTAIVAAVGSNGTLTNAGNTSASHVTGPGGMVPSGISFDGTNDFIAPAAAMQGPQSACAFTMWVKAPGSGIHVLDAMYSNAGIYAENASYTQFYLNGTGAAFRIHQGTNAALAYIGRTAPSGSITANTWMFMVGTWDGSTSATGCKIFVNTAQVDTANDAAGTFTAPNATSIHLDLSRQAIGASEFYGNASLADFRLYPHALTTAEISTLYHQKDIYAPHPAYGGSRLGSRAK